MNTRIKVGDTRVFGTVGNGNNSPEAFNELVNPGLEDILGHLQSERHSLESVAAEWRVECRKKT